MPSRFLQPATPPSQIHRHTHADGSVHGSQEATFPTQPSEAVVLDIGEHTGALVLRSCAQREGLEVEIHRSSQPAQRIHVWVLARRGPKGEPLYAAIFPSLEPDSYTVLDVDGSEAYRLDVPANGVTYGTWGHIT